MDILPIAVAPVIGFIVFIILLWRAPFVPGLYYGRFEKVRHLSQGSNQAHERKKEIIDELSRDPKTQPIGKYVFGEFSTTKCVRESLANRMRLEVIVGPKLANEASKKELVALMNSYQGLIKVFIAKERPQQHAMLIGPHLFIEQKHEAEKDYKEALILYNAKKRFVSRFNEDFNRLTKDARLATIPDVQKLPTYHDGKTIQTTIPTAPQPALAAQ